MLVEHVNVRDALNTIRVDDNHTICVVPSETFRELVKSHHIIPSHGWRFDVARYEDGTRAIILIANRSPPRIEQIDRDDAWARRLELAFHLEHQLGDQLT